MLRLVFAVITVACLLITTSDSQVIASTKPVSLTLKQVKEIECIAHAVYHEARGEPYEGQLAVAYVVVNRKLDKEFSSNACQVVYQKAQFTDILLTKPNTKSTSWRRAIEIATEAYFQLEDDPTNGSRFFYAPDKINTPRWAYNQVGAVRIGAHRFFDIGATDDKG